MILNTREALGFFFCDGLERVSDAFVFAVSDSL